MNASAAGLSMQMALCPGRPESACFMVPSAPGSPGLHFSTYPISEAGNNETYIIMVSSGDP